MGSFSVQMKADGIGLVMTSLNYKYPPSAAAESYLSDAADALSYPAASRFVY